MIIIIDSSSKYILLKWRKIPSGSREYEIFGIAVLCFFFMRFSNVAGFAVYQNTQETMATHIR